MLDTAIPSIRKTTHHSFLPPALGCVIGVFNPIGQDAGPTRLGTDGRGPLFQSKGKVWFPSGTERHTSHENSLWPQSFNILPLKHTWAHIMRLLHGSLTFSLIITTHPVFQPFLSFFFPDVCVGVGGAHLSVWMHMCVQVCMWTGAQAARRSMSVVCLNCFSTLFFEARLLDQSGINSPFELERRVGRPGLLTLPSPTLQCWVTGLCRPPHPAFYMGTGDSNSGLKHFSISWNHLPSPPK